MKILILASNLSNEAGGYSESSFLLRENLSKIKKNKVFLLGYWVSKIYEFQYKITEKINLFSPDFSIIKFHFSFSILKKIKKIQPDVIDIQGLWSSSSIINQIYQLIRPTPYIITPRGMLENWALKKSYWKKKLFYYLFEKWHIKNAACLRATSLNEARQFRRLGFKNLIVSIPNFIKIPKENKNLKKKNKYKLLFLSRLDKKKGLDELLHAWKYIENKFPDWELVIAGYSNDTQYLNKLKEIERKLNIKNVKWHGFYFGKKKNELYQSADLFILLSHSENFGLVIAEALSNSLPVITTNNTPWKDLNKKGCGWCIQLKRKKIINTLTSAMSLDAGKRYRMGKKGREWIIKNFSEKSVRLSLHKLYSSIANKRQIKENQTIN